MKKVKYDLISILLVHSFSIFYTDTMQHLSAPNWLCIMYIVFNVQKCAPFVSDKTEKTDYDPYHRNPMYCHAENECIWELEGLAGHYHPTVALFAKQILKV